MNKESSDRLIQVLTTAIIIAVIIIVYSLGRQLIIAIADHDSEYAAPLIVTAGTIIVTVLSVVLSRYYETRSAIEKEHRDNKIPVYEDLLKFMFKIFMGTKTGNPVSEKEMIDFMSKFNQVAMVWASDDVLSAWIKFRSTSMDEEQTKNNPIRLMVVFEDLIREIRKDLGHKNKNLTNGKILSLFVNDIEKYFDSEGNICEIKDS
ncbi:hypothetical protein [Gimesia sp.]|uniref:hypothetical protein n=1 Tax=Gimesia sp. TaxID=2024833 RepID=UPI0032EF1A30